MEIKCQFESDYFDSEIESFFLNIVFEKFYFWFLLMSDSEFQEPCFGGDALQLIYNYLRQVVINNQVMVSNVPKIVFEKILWYLDMYLTEMIFNKQ